MTPTEAFESSLARSDSLVLRGKFTGGGTTGTTPGNPGLVFNVHPSNLGTRANSIYTAFSRWRVKSLTIKFFVNPASTTVGMFALGLVDDVQGEGEQPTTFDTVSELRCSGVNFINQYTPTEISFKPLDAKKWYYCPGGISGSETRLVYPASIYTASTVASSTYDYQINYVLVFSGAAP
jgi:hypothetical protein